MDWAKWHVFWADERMVKKDHPDSNYKLAWDGLLSKVTFSFQTIMFYISILCSLKEVVSLCGVLKWKDKDQNLPVVRLDF